jgi:dephospho-CoA kinase
VEKPLIILAPWYPCLYTDDEARKIMSSAGVINAIKETLARQFFNNILNRSMLAEIVFLTRIN